MGELRTATAFAAFARLARSLNEGLDLSDMLGRVAHEARAALGGEASAVYLGDASRGMVVEAADNLGQAAIGERIAPGEEGESLFEHLGSAVTAPLRWGGAVRGGLAVGYGDDHRASAEERRALETFAALAAAACRTADADVGLATAARTDGLTGCLNHAALQDALRREVMRCERTGQSLAIVLFDVDDFKQVNDRHGHLVGDEVLRRAGHALRGAVRPYDLCARYGGDEFAILCVDTDEPTAAEIGTRAAARLLEAIRDVDGDVTSGATAGVAGWEAGQAPARLLEQADRALLFGKQEGGRGAVVRASSLPEVFHPGRFRRPGDPPPEHARGGEPEMLGDAGAALRFARLHDRLETVAREAAEALAAHGAASADLQLVATCEGIVSALREALDDHDRAPPPAA